MGTPEFAVPSLDVVAARAEVVQVVTQPDRARGRGRSVTPSPVAAAAERLGIPVMRPGSMRGPEVREALAVLAPDVFAVVAFGAILPPALLAVPRIGSINLHGSVLPDYRGAAPVQRALWDGRAWTGLTTIWMDEGVDTGDMILQQWSPIAADDDAGTLAARLAREGAPLLAESVMLAHAGRAPRVPQERDAGTRARKLTREEGAIDWQLDAVTVWNRARAVTPWPGAVVAWEGGRVLVTRARPLHLMPAEGPAGAVLAVTKDEVHVQCGTGALALVQVRPEARADMSAAAWARGARCVAGARFGTQPSVMEEHA